LLIYGYETLYGPGKQGPAIQEIVSVHDGPFADAKEQLGGCYLIEAKDVDEAIAVADVGGVRFCESRRPPAELQASGARL
jgi:hypothetical protein